MRIWRANEQILKRLGGSWFDPPLPAIQLAEREWAVPSLRVEVECIIEWAAGAPVAIKDPRIGVMTPLWHPLIVDRFHPVLVIRDPIEIALSLARRDGMPMAFALAAWELHMRALLDYLDGTIATVAPYAQLIEDRRQCASVVEQASAHVEPGRAAHVQPAAAYDALERGFRHNRAVAEDHDEHLTRHQLDLWQWLRSLPAGDQRIGAPPALREPSEAARAAVRSESERARVAGELESERAHRAELEATLASEREDAAALAALLVAEQERASSAAESLAGEQQRCAALAAELASERERAQDASAAQLRAEGWLAAVQGSASWRLTEPLRAAKHTLPRQRARASRLLRRGSADALRYEIHIPISPTPPFITRIHYLAATLRRFGGALADCPIIVTVGADEHTDLARAYPWSDRLGVQWRWLDDSLWRRHGIYATALQRFCYELEEPNALLLDSDTLFVRPIDDLLRTLGRGHAIAGVLAHISPFIGCDGGQDLWERIFQAAGLGSPSLQCEHPGWQAIEFDPTRRYCPPYFNLGVLFAPRDVLGALASTIYAEMETVERVHPTLFRCQIALALAIARSGVAWQELPLRFNLPNLAEYLPRYQAELADARIIHYLKDEQFSRVEDFASAEHVGALLAREDLNPFNTTLRDTFRQVHPYVLAEG